MKWNDSDLSDLAHTSADQEIEAVLRQIALKEPSPLLDRRVLRTLRGSSAMAQLRAAGLGAAAAALLALAIVPSVMRAKKPVTVSDRSNVNTPVHRTAVQAKHPLRIERSISRIIDDGVVGSTAGVPLQQFRYRSVRQIWVVDPRGGTRLAVTVPDDRVVLVPVRTF